MCRGSCRWQPFVLRFHSLLGEIRILNQILETRILESPYLVITTTNTVFLGSFNQKTRLFGPVQTQILEPLVIGCDPVLKFRHLNYLLVKQSHLRWEVGDLCVPADVQNGEIGQLVYVGGDGFDPVAEVARWQNLIPSFPWIAPGWRAWGAIQGKEGIKFCSVA